MPLSTQQISDRLEIQELLLDYCIAIDSGQFDELDDIFTADAFIDYTCFGGPKGQYPEIKKFLQEALPGFPAYQHMIGPSRIFLEGDRARARTICHNPMYVPLPTVEGEEQGRTQLSFFGIWYVDKLLRTEQGWRMTERVEEPGHTFNLPPHMRGIEFRP